MAQAERGKTEATQADAVSVVKRASPSPVQQEKTRGGVTSRHAIPVPRPRSACPQWARSHLTFPMLRHSRAGFASFSP